MPFLKGRFFSLFGDGHESEFLKCFLNHLELSYNLNISSIPVIVSPFLFLFFLGGGEVEKFYSFASQKETQRALVSK